jgi:hypothetical protein
VLAGVQQDVEVIGAGVLVDDLLPHSLPGPREAGGVQRVGDGAARDGLREPGPQAGRLGHVDVLLVGQVAGQLREPAGHGEHGQPGDRAPVLPRQLLQELHPVDQVVDVVGRLDPGLPERDVIDPRVGGQGAGVGRGHALSALSLAHLHGDDRLARLQAAVGRLEEHVRAPDLLDRERDHLGHRVVGQVVQEVGDVGHGLVPGRDEQVEAGDGSWSPAARILCLSKQYYRVPRRC